MKIIVSGLLYDTDKADVIYSSEFIFGTDIYKTPNNRLFMLDCAGIINTDQDKCKQYLGKVAPDKYIELFGEVEEA